MPNIFDDSYSNKIIQQLCRIDYHDFGDYKNLGVCQTLTFSYYDSEEAQIVQTKNNDIALWLDSKYVDMTPLIEQRCKALLYKHKLKHEQYISKDKKYLKQAKDIIATEQKSDMYQQYADIRPKHYFIQNKPYFLVLIPHNTTVKYVDGYFETHGKYKPLFKLLTRIMYNNGKSAEINVKKKNEGGFVCETPTGNRFDFNTWTWAQIFAQSFDKDRKSFGCAYYPNHIFVRVKTGITR